MARGRTQHYLVVFDHEKDELDRIEEFGTNTRKALDAYSATETRYRDRPRMEVVLLGAESLDTLRVTHPTYFAGGLSPSEFADGLFRWAKGLAEFPV